MLKDLQYNIREKIWVYKGKGTWYFVTLPEAESAQIKFLNSSFKRGWGSVPVEVTIGQTSWKTSIFPESKTKCYILPIKADVRKKENIKADDLVDITLMLNT